MEHRSGSCSARVAALRRPRRRRGLAGRAHDAAAAAASGTCCWWRRWPCRRSSTASPGSRCCPASRLRRRAADRHPVLLPARLPAGRRRAARAGPGAGGDRARPRARSSWAVFRRVRLPQLRAALLGGALLVGAAPARGVRRAADAALSDLHHRDLRPVPVHLQRRPAPRCWPASSCCSAWLLLLAELRLRGRRGYARIGGGARPAGPPGGARPAHAAGAGRAGRRSSASRSSSRSAASATGWSPAPRPRFDRPTLLHDDADDARAGGWRRGRDRRRWRCPRLAGGPRPRPGRRRCSSAAPTSAARCRASSSRWRWSRWHPATPGALPDGPLLLAAYAILFLPLAMVSRPRRARAVAAGLRRRRARRSAPRPLDRLRRVTLPLLAPGIGAGAALVFLAVVTELTATLLLAPTGTTRWPPRSGRRAAPSTYGAAAPVRGASWCCSPRPLPYCCPAMPDEV